MPKKASSSAIARFRMIRRGKSGMRQAGLPIPTMSHALSASEVAINSLLCSPPVKSIAGPCGGGGSRGRRDVVKCEKRDWRLDGDDKVSGYAKAG